MADPAQQPPPLDPSALNIPPSPALMPELWDSIAIGPYNFPPVPGQDGLVRVEFSEELKIDAQQSDGTDKATTKTKGVAPTKGKLTVEWTSPIWTEGAAFCKALSPNGPNKGTPFDIIHPEAGLRSLGQVIIGKAGKLEVKSGGRRYSQTFEFEEWNPPDEVEDDPGNVDTPAKAAKWGSSKGDNPQKTRGTDVTVPAGFLGPNGPKADP